MNLSIESATNAEYTMYCVDCNALVTLNIDNMSHEHELEVVEVCW